MSELDQAARTAEHQRRRALLEKAGATLRAADRLLRSCSHEDRKALAYIDAELGKVHEALADLVGPPIREDESPGASAEADVDEPSTTPSAGDAGTTQEA